MELQVPEEVELIENGFQTLKDSIKKQLAKPLNYRIKQLSQLKEGITKLQDELRQALWMDLHRNKVQADFVDIDVVKAHIDLVLQNLHKWSQPVQLDTPVLVGPADSYINYEPMGIVLIVGSWNFPVHVTLTPLVYAISAGNLAFIKPSEMSPNTSIVISKLIRTYLDKQSYICIQGGPKVISQILNLRFDLIVYTGSTEKGKLVYQAAAKQLTPCILELGGQCPVIVDSNANLKNAALRIVQGKFTNAGQICLAPDYLLVHKDVQHKLLELIKENIQTFYGIDPQESSDYGRIINQNHTRRLMSLVEGSQGQIIQGGKIIVEDRYVEPTLILNPDSKSEIVNSEIFGPLLPVFSFSQLQEAIDYVNSKDKPLSVYYFGKARTSNQVKYQTSSGSFVVNEVMFQAGNPNLPFGGVGLSGMGRYYGKFGFESMSNPKSVFHKGCINIYPFNVRYPPFTSHKENLLKFMSKYLMFPERNLKKSLLVATIFGITYALFKNKTKILDLVKGELKKFK